MREQIKTCFISAPPSANVGQIRDSLLERNVSVIGLTNIQLGSVVQTAIINSINAADLVVAVLSHGQTANPLFELGLAVGLGKQVMIFAPAKGDIVPSDLQGFPVVRTSLQNREAIDFAFDQLLASSESSPRMLSSPQTERPFRTLHGTSYRDELHGLAHQGSERELENLVARALRDAGAEIVAESPQRDRGIDLVIWSDDLQPYVGNPFPIEIKRRLASREDAKRALSSVASAASAIGSSWSLLLYAEGPGPEDRIWWSQPSVLAIGLHELFYRLEEQSFADIIRSLRNRRVHGGNL